MNDIWYVAEAYADALGDIRKPEEFAEGAAWALEWLRAMVAMGQAIRNRYDWIPVYEGPWDRPRVRLLPRPKQKSAIVEFIEACKRT